MVIWIIGLSGSGKTYLSKKIFKKLKGKKILIDGDTVRKYLTYNLKYSLNDRKKNSQLISDLCKFLESHGFTVVCSILSIFNEHQKQNRTQTGNQIKRIRMHDKTKIKRPPAAGPPRASCIKIPIA